MTQITKGTWCTTYCSDIIHMSIYNNHSSYPEETLIDKISDFQAFSLKLLRTNIVPLCVVTFHWSAAHVRRDIRTSLSTYRCAYGWQAPATTTYHRSVALLSPILVWLAPDGARRRLLLPHHRIYRPLFCTDMSINIIFKTHLPYPYLLIQ